MPIVAIIMNLRAQLPADRLLNNEQTVNEYQNANGACQQAPAYPTTRDGFTLLDAERIAVQCELRREGRQLFGLSDARRYTQRARTGRLASKSASSNTTRNSAATTSTAPSNTRQEVRGHGVGVRRAEATRTLYKQASIYKAMRGAALQGESCRNGGKELQARGLATEFERTH